MANAASLESKAKKATGALYRVFGRLDCSCVFSTIYQCKILPIILYGLPVSAPSSKAAFERLERVQRFAARLVLNDYQSSYHELLFKLQWNSIGRYCFERRCSLAHKYLYGLRHLPSDCLKVQVSIGRHSARVSRPHDLSLLIPYYKWITVDKLPLYQLFNTWNNLPECVAMLASPRSIKNCVRSPVVYSFVQHKAPDLLCSYDNSGAARQRRTKYVSPKASARPWNPL